MALAREDEAPVDRFSARVFEKSRTLATTRERLESALALDVKAELESGAGLAAIRTSELEAGARLFFAASTSKEAASTTATSTATSTEAAEPVADRTFILSRGRMRYGAAHGYAA